MGLTAGARAWATEFEETSATPRETALPGKALRPEHGVDNSNEPTASEGEEGSSIAVRMARFGWPAVKRRPSPCRPAPAMEPIRVSVPPLPKQPGPCEPSAVKSCAPLAAQSAFASARSNYDDLTPRSGARAAQREYLARMEAQIQRAPSQGQPCSSWEARAGPRPASSRSAAPSSSFDGAAKATVCYSGPSANAPTSARCAGTAAGTAASTVAGTAAGTVAGTAALPATTRGRTCSSARAPAAGWSGDATHLSFWELCESDEHLPELRRRLARQVGNSFRRRPGRIDCSVWKGAWSRGQRWRSQSSPRDSAHAPACGGELWSARRGGRTAASGQQPAHAVRARAHRTGGGHREPAWAHCKAAHVDACGCRGRAERQCALLRATGG
jgi:hypothetical protein